MGQFLNVDRGQAVFLRNTLRQQDGVFVVETVPRHEGDTEVLTQSQLTQIHRRTISHHIATLYHVTSFHQRTLVDAGVLVRTGVFGQVVDVHTSFASHGFIVVNLGDHTHTGVLCNRTLHTGTHQRLL